jgi:glycosyltransferase involved in cell wall biosynthesis
MNMVSGQYVQPQEVVRPYRVLMIAPTSFFADYGCHVRILEEARTLQRMGHQVTIVTYHNGNHVPGLDIRRTLPIPWRKDYEVGSSRHKIGLDVFLGAKALELVIRERFDVIHAHLHEGALIGLFLSRLFRIPLVFDFQGSLTGEMLDHRFLRRQSFAYNLFRRLETWIDHHSPAILASTANAERVLIEDFGCRPKQIYSLPDCVDTDTFRPAAAYDPALLDDLRHRVGIPPGRRLIVYLGLLVEHQGIGILLQAMQRVIQEHQDAHLLLMGFPSVEFYRTQAQQLGIGASVTLTGRVPYEQAPAYLALGDVAVAPKLSLTEGSGKLLNYMAVALPTVAFDTPVAREFLGPDGLFAAPGDIESLAQHLCRALSLTSDASAVLRGRGQRLRQRAMQHFGWDEAGRQIVNTYRQLLGDAGAATGLRPGWTVTHK